VNDTTPDRGPDVFAVTVTVSSHVPAGPATVPDNDNHDNDSETDHDPPAVTTTDELPVHDPKLSDAGDTTNGTCGKVAVTE
jgi:hypothetical protein